MALRQNMTESVKDNSRIDLQFHLAIADACHNKILSDLYHSVSAYMESHIAERQAKTSLDPAEIDALHEHLYDAIRDGKDTEAQACAHNILKI